MCGLALCAMIARPVPAYAGHKVTIRLQLSLPTSVEMSRQEQLRKIDASEKIIKQLLGGQAQRTMVPDATYVYTSNNWDAALSSAKRDQFLAELRNCWGHAISIAETEEPAEKRSAPTPRPGPAPFKLHEGKTTAHLKDLPRSGETAGALFDGSGHHGSLTELPVTTIADQLRDGSFFKLSAAATRPKPEKVSVPALNLDARAGNLPEKPIDDFFTYLGEVPFTLFHALDEVEGQRRFDWETNGRVGQPVGWKSPMYYHLQGESGKFDYVYEFSIDAGYLVSFTLSHVVNQALKGEPAFDNYNVIDMFRHMVFNWDLEDALYWIIKGQPVNLTWMRQNDNAFWQTMSENSPLGIPYIYNFSLGAVLAGPLISHRAGAKENRNMLGLGENNTFMDYADFTARAANLGGIALAAIPILTGKPLAPGLQAAGAVCLSGGVADGFATVQDGIRRRSVPGALAGGFSLLANLFQMSAYSAYEGRNQHGLPNQVQAPRISVPAVVLGAISWGLRALDAAGK